MIGTLETLIYDCPNSTSNGPPKGSPEKNGPKSWGVTREVGGQDPTDPPVVAPLPGGRLDTKLSTIYRKWSCPESLTQRPLIVRVELGSARWSAL